MATTCWWRWRWAASGITNVSTAWNASIRTASSKPKPTPRPSKSDPRLCWRTHGTPVTGRSRRRDARLCWWRWYWTGLYGLPPRDEWSRGHGRRTAIVSAADEPQYVSTRAGRTQSSAVFAASECQWRRRNARVAWYGRTRRAARRRWLGQRILMMHVNRSEVPGCRRSTRTYVLFVGRCLAMCGCQEAIGGVLGTMAGEVLICSHTTDILVGCGVCIMVDAAECTILGGSYCSLDD